MMPLRKFHQAALNMFFYFIAELGLFVISLLSGAAATTLYSIFLPMPMMNAAPPLRMLSNAVYLMRNTTLLPSILKDDTI